MVWQQNWFYSLKFHFSTTSIFLKMCSWFKFHCIDILVTNKTGLLCDKFLLPIAAQYCMSESLNIYFNQENRIYLKLRCCCQIDCFHRYCMLLWQMLPSKIKYSFSSTRYSISAGSSRICLNLSKPLVYFSLNLYCNKISS